MASGSPLLCVASEAVFQKGWGSRIRTQRSRSVVPEVELLPSEWVWMEERSAQPHSPGIELLPLGAGGDENPGVLSLSGRNSCPRLETRGEVNSVFLMRVTQNSASVPLNWVWGMPSVLYIFTVLTQISKFPLINISPSAYVLRITPKNSWFLK